MKRERISHFEDKCHTDFVMPTASRGEGICHTELASSMEPPRGDQCSYI